MIVAETRGRRKKKKSWKPHLLKANRASNFLGSFYGLDCRQLFNGLLDECDSLAECIGVECEPHAGCFEQFR